MEAGLSCKICLGFLIPEVQGGVYIDICIHIHVYIYISRYVYIHTCVYIHTHTTSHRYRYIQGVFLFLQKKGGKIKFFIHQRKIIGSIYIGYIYISIWGQAYLIQFHSPKILATNSVQGQGITIRKKIVFKRFAWSSKEAKEQDKILIVSNVAEV